MQDPAAHGPCASIEHKVIYQVPLSVQSLGSHTRGAPAKQGGAQHEENVPTQEFNSCEEVSRDTMRRAEWRQRFWGRFNTQEAQWGCLAVMGSLVLEKTSQTIKSNL